MNTSDCPFHTKPSSSAPVHPVGVWPPGPAVGLTGWSLLQRMSRDLFGTLSAWQHEFGDVVHVPIWPEHQIVLTDPQLMRELLVIHHKSLVRWERGLDVFTRLEGQSVFTTEGETWQQKRHALHPSFSLQSMQTFIPTIVEAMSKALAQWPKQARSWPIESALTSLTMDVIMRMLFSSEIGADARQAEQAVHTLLVYTNAELYWPASWPDWMPWKRSKRKALHLLQSLIARHVQARLQLPDDTWPDDMLSRLLYLHRQQPEVWSLQAICDECITSFIAGHETTAATLTWWAWCMAANPEVQDQARQEVQQVLQGQKPTADKLPALESVAQTLKETLRLYPTAPVLFTRRSTQPITLGGWQLPARTLFAIPVYLLHQDARWFANPQAFQPERFGQSAADIPRGAYLPFGIGPHVCLGQHLALTEMTVIAAMFLQHFRLSVPEGMTVPQPVLNVSLRPSQPLRLQVDVTS